MSIAVMSPYALEQARQQQDGQETASPTSSSRSSEGCPGGSHLNHEFAGIGDRGTRRHQCRVDRRRGVLLVPDNISAEQMYEGCRIHSDAVMAATAAIRYAGASILVVVVVVVCFCCPRIWLAQPVCHGYV